MTPEKKFSFGINAIPPVQSCRKKEIASRFPQIKSITVAIPSHRGAFRDRHGRWCGMRWTRQRRKTGAAHADGEVVWFWRPDAGAKSVVRPTDDGGKRARSPGRARRKPLKPLRRECRLM